MTGEPKRRGYRARWLIDGRGGEPLENATLVVADGLIVELRPPGQPLDDLELLDQPDGTLLPGLIDAHVHLVWDGGLDPEGQRATEGPLKGAIRAARHARATLQAGTIAVRDLGAPAGINLALRDLVRQGVVPGPRIRAAGQLITMTGGHCHGLGREADGPEGVRLAAREQFKAGADLLKLLATGGVYAHDEEPGSPQLGLEELLPGVEEARKRGKPVAIHAEGIAGLRAAIEANPDTIEHGNELTPELADRMAERGIALGTTLSFFQAVATEGAAAGVPLEYVEKARRMWEAAFRAVGYARAAGVTIVAGTDAGAPLTPHSSIRREIRLLAEAGCSRREALQAATVNAATALNWTTQLGSLEPGKLADFILVRGNPLDDLTRLDDLLLVVQGGVDAR
jgi:imidazolonepropionase-like amidohydrolase